MWKFMHYINQILQSIRTLFHGFNKTLVQKVHQEIKVYTLQRFTEQTFS